MRIMIPIIEKLRLSQISLDRIGEAVFWLDSTGRFIHANRAARKILGYARAELASMSLSDIDCNLPAADWPSRWRTLKARGTLTFESYFRTKTGGTIPVETTFTFLSHRGTELALAHARNLSEQKRSAWALTRSERNYHDLLAHSQDGVWRMQLEQPIPVGVSAQEATEKFRTHGYITECNGAFADILGSSDPARLTRKRCKDVNPLLMPDSLGMDRSTTPCTWRKRVFHSVIVDANGHVKSVAGTAIPVVENGMVLGVWGILRDVTGPNHLQVERSYLAAAIEQASEGIVITDATGAIEHVNPAFTLMTGYTLEEVRGRNPRILKSGKQDAEVYENMWGTLLAGRPWRGEIVNKRKGGNCYSEQMTITPVRNQYGQTTHYVAIKEDLTARKILEAEFRQAQRTESVGRLAAGVAHDFNNLLQIIIGFSDLALGELLPESSAREYLQEIKNTTDRAASLTRQLLAFSRQQVMAPRVLDLRVLVANLIKMLRRLIGEDIDLITRFADDLHPIKADAGQIEQVIVNLVVNARDAMPGGGEITLRIANTELDEEFARAHFPMTKGSYVMLAVTDTGCGMDKPTQARVFEPFFTTKDRSKGTGLGLATVYGIIKQTGGYIWVQSEVGKGATFTIYFPPVEETAETSEVTAPPEATRGAETVLVVEDVLAVRSLLCQALEARGYTVLEARDGMEALAMLQRSSTPVQLLITDLVMPGMSGQELAERFVALRKEARVLYMTGYTDRPLPPDHLPGTQPTLLVKPFSAEMLAQTVRALLDRT